MVNVVAQNGKYVYNLKRFICDTENDLKTIITYYCAAGSNAFVVETGNTYVLNGDREWGLIPNNTTGDDTEELTQQLAQAKETIAKQEQTILQLKEQIKQLTTPIINEQNGIIEIPMSDIDEINGVWTIPNATIQDNILILGE